MDDEYDRSLIEYVLEQISEYGLDNVLEGGADEILSGWRSTTIHVCAGPPACSLQGDDAVAAQEKDCPWCKRILIRDGVESVTEPSKQ